MEQLNNPSDRQAKAAEIVKQYTELQLSLYGTQEIMGRLKDELQSLLIENSNETKTWIFDTARVTWLKPGKTERLDKSKLVRLGVTPDIIEAATIKGERAPGFRIEPI